MNGQRSLDNLAEELLGKQSNALSASERRVLKHIHNRQVMDYVMNCYLPAAGGLSCQMKHG